MFPLLTADWTVHLHSRLTSRLELMDSGTLSPRFSGVEPILRSWIMPDSHSVPSDEARNGACGLTSVGGAAPFSISSQFHELSLDVVILELATRSLRSVPRRQ